MSTLSELKKIGIFFEDNNVELKKSLIRFYIPTVSFFSDEKKVIGAEFELIVFSKIENKKPDLYVIGANLPFHPHFHIDTSEQKAKWVDYIDNNSNENISDFLQRVFLSLQYYPDYVIPSQYKNMKIANKDAKKWYLAEKQKKPVIFPTSDFLHKIQEGIDVQYQTKKFEIQNDNNKIDCQKKFEIQESKNDNNDEKKENTTVAKKKFLITKVISEYTPIEKEYISFETNNILDALSNQSDDKVKIYITEAASQQILKHISWGEDTGENKNEQGGILVGNVYIDKEKNIQYAIVEQAIAGLSAKGSSAYIEFGHEVWKEMIDMVDVYLEENPDKSVQIIGWYHTHPRNLGVFMSHTDINTQKLHFNKNWHYAIVLNPQKKIWKAFYGEQAHECLGYFMNYHAKPHQDSDSIKKSTNTDKESWFERVRRKFSKKEDVQ